MRNPLVAANSAIFSQVNRVREWHRLPGAVTAPASELSGEDVDREADADAGDEDDNQGGERGEDTER